MPWGRQIAVAMTEDDEQAFLAYLRTTTDIEIFVAGAATPAQLHLAELPSRSSGQKQFLFWNTAFPWQPEVAPTTVGTVHLANTYIAPLIEYDRHPLSPSSRDLGRLYWSKSIAPGGQYEFKGLPYAYDARAFNTWYEQVVTWVKKHSHSKRSGRLAVYYLPSAWREYGWRTP